MREPQVLPRRAPEAASALLMRLESEPLTGPSSSPPRREERRHCSGVRARAGARPGTRWPADPGVASGRLPPPHCLRRPQTRQRQQHLTVVLLEPLGGSRPLLAPCWCWQRFVRGRHSHCPLRCLRCRHCLHCLHSPYCRRQSFRCCCSHCSHCCRWSRCCCCFGVLLPHPGPPRPGGL